MTTNGTWNRPTDGSLTETPHSAQAPPVRPSQAAPPTFTLQRDETERATAVGEAPAVSRLEAIWSARWFLIVAVVIGTVAAYVASGLQPTRYSAQSTVRVSLLGAQSSPDQAVIAQNDLAAQFAQLATTQPVKTAAAAALGVNPSALGTVSASPLHAFNIIGITVRTASAAGSAAQARAMSTALVQYIDKHNLEEATAAGSTVAPQLKALDHQIAQLQATINREQSSGSNSATASVLPGQLSLLSSLTSQRSNIFTAQERATNASQPTLTVLDQPGSGGLVSKHRPLYAGAAFVVVLLGGFEIAVLAARLRRVSVRRGS